MTHNVQTGRGEATLMTAKAMPNEALVVHVPDPEKNRLIKVNDIAETRYAKVIAVGAPRGRYREAPVKVGDIVLLETATAGVHVPGLYHENKPVHRLDWVRLLAVVEEQA